MLSGFIQQNQPKNIFHRTENYPPGGYPAIPENRIMIQ